RAQFDVDIFLHTSATPAEIDAFGKMLAEMNEIQSVTYISPDSAAEKFKQEFGEDIFDILDYNPLPPSFTIRLKPEFRNLAGIEQISGIVSGISLVDEAKYRKNFLVLLEKYQRYTLTTVFTVFAFLTLISILLIANSIKMTIVARRDVISTMKLVGATNNFIRAPFLIEGTLQGFIGAIFASIFIAIVFYFLNNYLQTIISYRAIVSYRFYAGIILFGGALGLTGSTRAIRKFLK
ncbi:MAG: permease-like cell division protein FtsX, partial [Candidatus Marinimicrobia bacterium]|nr:permease-like cell division protein FtsX [Candidatus Neomarinimicrobiota bacterium]